MPQINRIRVNNVKYNFKTQFYDDFLMRFSGKNVIYDLANGGGKSVLLLLMMQNMIPNCSLDEKQPVDKLFSEAGGSTVIHSLIEWKLDSCYIKDGFRYMTTGFCARRGKENAMEYFNYCIFYRDYGENDIKNLPLEENNKRITYQGLRNYLKDLHKNDLGVKVYIFDRKNDYQRFITEYGIFESHWELIRGINKTEGHVRTYFETNYKRARKVVEDLFIEQIIEKSFNNRLGIDSEDENMAKALFNIRGRLLELGQKKKAMDLYDNQCALLDEFSESLGGLLGLFKKRDEVREELLNCFDIAVGKIALADKNNEKLAFDLKTVDEECARYKKLLSCVNIYSGMDELAALEDDCQNALKRFEEYDIAAEKERNALRMGEALLCYNDYRDNAIKADAYVKSLSEDHEGESTVLTSLANVMNAEVKEKVEALKEELADLNRRIKEAEEILSVSVAKEKNDDKELAVLKDRLRVKEEQVAALKENYLRGRASLEIGLDDDLKKVCESLEKKSSEAELKLLEASERLEAAKRDDEALKAKKTGILANIALLEKMQQSEAERASEKAGLLEKVEKLKDVYMVRTVEDLRAKILEMLIKTCIQINDNDTFSLALGTDMENTRVNNLVNPGEHYREICEYLNNNYEEKIYGGYEWFLMQPKNIRRDLIRRVPFIGDSVVFCGDIEKLRSDVNLKNMIEDDRVIFIVGENILYESRNAIGCDNVVLVRRDVSYMDDEDRRKEHIDRLNERIEELSVHREKLAAKKDVLMKDFALVISVGGEDSSVGLEEDLAAKRKEILALNASVEESELLLEKAVKNYDLQREDRDKALALYKAASDAFAVYEEYVDRESELKILSAREKEMGITLEQSAYAVKEYTEDLSGLNELKSAKAASYEEILRINRDIDPFVTGNETNESGETLAELYAKFKVSKELLEEKQGDKKDKERLIAVLRDNMKKQEDQIAYLGFDMDEIKKASLDAGNQNITRETLSAAKKGLDQTIKEKNSLAFVIEKKKEEISYKKGAIANAKAAYEDEFKTAVLVEREECTVNKESYEAFIAGAVKRKKDFADRLQKNKEESLVYAGLKKSLSKLLGEACDGRIALNIDDLPDKNTADIEKDMNSYGDIEKEISRQMNVYYRNKVSLRDGLLLNKASELSASTESLPNNLKDAKEIESIRENIKAAKELIVLEKGRIMSNIEDMLALKDAFENRCLNTCENIRNSLEKFSSSSKITLDDKIVPVVKLTIPYVDEVQKKARMGAYIDDIVVMCQSFPDDEERIRYIKDKLTWKKLFSVIVTDMNDIKLSLYKRERNASQSRFLRYEEAVGSTGQSQGIYIQFLIAVINYIANINAAARGEGIVGSTVFIDNPFGAAKDIYIWEPIFKLLKANHVQLVVPARGATPAIIGRFEINYILGQVKQEDMLQTVVSDYRTEVDESVVEYEKMEFEQTSLELT